MKPAPTTKRKRESRHRSPQLLSRFLWGVQARCLWFGLRGKASRPKEVPFSGRLNPLQQRSGNARTAIEARANNEEETREPPSKPAAFVAFFVGRSGPMPLVRVAGKSIATEGSPFFGAAEPAPTTKRKRENRHRSPRQQRRGNARAAIEARSVCRVFCRRAFRPDAFGSGCREKHRDRRKSLFRGG
jgi:hypothetical protein